MALINIPTKSTGDTLSATELNTIVDSIKELERETGWAKYTDTQYTSESPLVITEGSTVTIDNNAVSTITNQLPYGVTSLYDNTTFKITPQNVGDGYLVRFDLTIFTNSPNGLAKLKLDIGDGITPNLILNTPLTFPKGTGSSNSLKESLTSAIYSLDTFIANGGTVKIESIIGDTSVYDINFLIFRTHKANS